MKDGLSIPRWRKRLGKVLAAPFVGLVLLYRWGIGPYLPKTCRFTPSCSTYALEALRKWGPLKGLWLAARRILRCNPCGGSGYDPVP